MLQEHINARAHSISLQLSSMKLNDADMEIVAYYAIGKNKVIYRFQMRIVIFIYIYIVTHHIISL